MIDGEKVQLRVIDRQGVSWDVAAEPAQSVMEAIRAAGIDELEAICGGCCSCATCHVYSDPPHADAFPPLGADEDDLLDGSDHRTENSRLACQLRVTPEFDGLNVTIAPEDW